ncbi:hypothetical protein COO60DRAFT_1488523 [Scenedesmus sp. NREL 46B-D3]|nr:hypothetical protein COO60DRAFT_1488523 [Scenedesmus sp. NREL 46B-D3]
MTMRPAAAAAFACGASAVPLPLAGNWCLAAGAAGASAAGFLSIAAGIPELYPGLVGACCCCCSVPGASLSVPDLFSP